MLTRKRKNVSVNAKMLGTSCIRKDAYNAMVLGGEGGLLQCVR